MDSNALIVVATIVIFAALFALMFIGRRRQMQAVRDILENDNFDMYCFQIRVTGVLILDDKLLIIKQHISNEREWSLPGGKLETGETLEQGIQREMFEETGLNISIERLLYVCDISPENQALHVTFLLNQDGGELALPDNSHDENPISDVKFVPINELSNYGFSERFIELAKAGFPNSGTYVGDKANIGLGI